MNPKHAELFQKLESMSIEDLEDAMAASPLIALKLRRAFESSKGGDQAHPKLSTAEANVLAGLGYTWNQFTKIGFVEPSQHNEFSRAIRTARDVIAFRFARRIASSQFYDYSEMPFRTDINYLQEKRDQE